MGVVVALWLSGTQKHPDSGEGSLSHQPLLPLVPVRDAGEKACCPARAVFPGYSEVVATPGPTQKSPSQTCLKLWTLATSKST